MSNSSNMSFPVSRNWNRALVRRSNISGCLFCSCCETWNPSTNWLAPPVPGAWAECSVTTEYEIHQVNVRGTVTKKYLNGNISLSTSTSLEESTVPRPQPALPPPPLPPPPSTEPSPMLRSKQSAIWVGISHKFSPNPVNGPLTFKCGPCFCEFLTCLEIFVTVYCMATTFIICETNSNLSQVRNRKKGKSIVDTCVKAKS